MAIDLTFSILFFLITTTLRKASAAGLTVPAVELWCVAKNNAEDSALQGALDWACSTGGANCAPIQQGGVCYDPADLERTASYAFNDYFLKSGMSEATCSFSNTAALTSLNPSHGNCKFPSSFTVKNRTATGSPVVGGGGPVSADLSRGNSVNARLFRPMLIILFLTVTWIYL